MNLKYIEGFVKEETYSSVSGFMYMNHFYGNVHIQARFNPTLMMC